MQENKNIISAIDHLIEQSIAHHRMVGTMIIVAQNATVLYKKASGYIDKEHKIAMPENAIFRLASITKSLVSAAAMRLVEKQIISLNDPITKYLPHFTPKLADGTTPSISLAHLMTHSSGLNYGFKECPPDIYTKLNISDGLDQAGLSLSENLSRLVQAPLLFKPGTQWQYSLSMDVLGGVLEAACKKNLDQILKEEVTQVLGLSDTAFNVSDINRLAPAYINGQTEPYRMSGTVLDSREDSSVVRFNPDRILDEKSYPSGGAGMAGTASDIFTFFETIRKNDGTILTKDSINLMMQNQLAGSIETTNPGWGFAYGWGILKDPIRAQTPQSQGTIQWGGAYGHSWFIDPSKQLTVVALSNTTPEGVGGQFPTDLIKAIYANI